MRRSSVSSAPSASRRALVPVRWASAASAWSRDCTWTASSICSKRSSAAASSRDSFWSSACSPSKRGRPERLLVVQGIQAAFQLGDLLVHGLALALVGQGRLLRLHPLGRRPLSSVSTRRRAPAARATASSPSVTRLSRASRAIWARVRPSCSFWSSASESPERSSSSSRRCWS